MKLNGNIFPYAFVKAFFMGNKNEVMGSKVIILWNVKVIFFYILKTSFQLFGMITDFLDSESH
ncbi:hypothetical protein XSR1_270033 [Xenorhabdus szentirmaii DSM 16338]|uniref:Uncharacterized protein n=1 Tax=Xenorhabdus szentirmaii DSM 16338 TaxID=1427518 RepID=W1IYV1_9GAMM|nr:hypothetical protein XSR1_270033 [Xenorhabdus szentirmaii DSM 16338]